jgi:hypothetical protein
MENENEKIDYQELFEFLDNVMAQNLEVDFDTYVETIEQFNDEDMDFILESFMTGTAEDMDKARELFKTKLK